MRSSNLIKILNLLLLMLLISGLSARPHNGEVFNLKQPDGTRVPVKVFGDEFYQDVESMDGYTLVRDKNTGWICYAELSANGKDYVSNGSIYDPNSNISRGISAKHLRITNESINEKSSLKREELNEPTNKELWERLKARGKKEKTRAVDTIVGITVLIDFPDKQADISHSEMDDLMNKRGYNKYSNHGSVADFFYDVSDGKLVYKVITTQYVRTPKNKSYYDTPDGYGPVAELIHFALNKLKSDGFDFSQLSSRNGRFNSINVLYAGSPDNGWSNGLWPHKGTLNGSFTANGIAARDYQITGIGTDPSIGTIVHENGHMLFYWPDLYAYDNSSNGAGGYCVMSYNQKKIPQQPNPYFRDIEGWIETVDITNAPLGSVYKHEANSALAYVHGGSGAGSANEYYYIEARLKEGWSSRIPDEGLIIWHVDEDGKNTYTGNEDHVVPEQADGLFEIENKQNSGRDGDCFHAGDKDRFTDNTSPSAKWHNGANSGIDIANISSIASEMTFSIGPDIDPFILISSPNGGEEFEQNKEYLISWNDNIDDPVKIILNKSNSQVLEITSAGADGEYLWTVPSDVEAGSGYTIEIVSTADNSLKDESDASFSIAAEFIIDQFPYVQNFESFELGEDLASHWDQLIDDDMNWIILNEATPSKVGISPDITGPDGDHTSGNGNYIYVEASDPNNPSKKANMISPTFNISGQSGLYLKFYYHMFSDSGHMGDLAVDISVDGVWENDVVTLSGDKGDEWHEQVVDLKDYSGERVKFRFRAVIGESWASDICVDDISVDYLTPAIDAKLNNSSHFTFNRVNNGISFSLPKGKSNYKTTLKVYDLQGREIKTLISKNLKSGYYRISTPAMKSIANGIYIMQLKAGSYHKNLRIIER